MASSIYDSITKPDLERHIQEVKKELLKVDPSSSLDDDVRTDDSATVTDLTNGELSQQAIAFQEVIKSLSTPEIEAQIKDIQQRLAEELKKRSAEIQPRASSVPKMGMSKISRAGKKVKKMKDLGKKQYCFCNGRLDDKAPMICCDSCNKWFHIMCVGLTATESKIMDTWACPGCINGPVPTATVAPSRKSQRKPKDPQEVEYANYIATLDTETIEREIPKLEAELKLAIEADRLAVAKAAEQERKRIEEETEKLKSTRIKLEQQLKNDELQAEFIKESVILAQTLKKVDDVTKKKSKPKKASKVPEKLKDKRKRAKQKMDAKKKGKREVGQSSKAPLPGSKIAKKKVTTKKTPQVPSVRDVASRPMPSPDVDSDSETDSGEDTHLKRMKVSKRKKMRKKKKNTVPSSDESSSSDSSSSSGDSSDSSDSSDDEYGSSDGSSSEDERKNKSASETESDSENDDSLVEKIKAVMKQQKLSQKFVASQSGLVGGATTLSAWLKGRKVHKVNEKEQQLRDWLKRQQSHPRTAPPPKGKQPKNNQPKQKKALFKPGMRVDVRDMSGSWVPGVVKETDSTGTQFNVTYEAQGQTKNEWIALLARRLASFGTHVTRKTPQKKRKASRPGNYGQRLGYPMFTPTKPTTRSASSNAGKRRTVLKRSLLYPSPGITGSAFSTKRRRIVLNLTPSGTSPQKVLPSPQIISKPQKPLVTPPPQKPAKKLPPQLASPPLASPPKHKLQLASPPTQLGMKRTPRRCTQERTDGLGLQKWSSEDAEDDDNCPICGMGGELISCDKCPKAYHGSCLSPPVDPSKLGNEDWCCPDCTKPVVAEPEKPEEPEEPSQDPPRKRRKQFSSDSTSDWKGITLVTGNPASQHKIHLERPKPVDSSSTTLPEISSISPPSPIQGDLFSKK